ncbi:MAG: hypothetical protein PHY47_21020 [Lachnospiraceae bacterium]|nr:hypothetical protein [Lachnospiraceae bacterium]
MVSMVSSDNCNNLVSEKEQQLIHRLKDISARGYNAEVKQNVDGTWTIYEVKKKKEKVG